MEYIKKEELIKDEIYIHDNGNIVSYQYLNDGGQVCGKFIGKSTNHFQSDLDDHPGRFTIDMLKLATSEEKHWLNTCIQQDKFITFEEAMKTFIPEYVECIIRYGLAEVNTIYKTSNNEEAYKLFSLNWYKTLIIYKHLQHKFKPSTKEAYDAQFVVKEPEFVLPEKWCVKCNESNYELIKKWANYSWWNYNFDRIITSNKTWSYNFGALEDYTEITFEQFKKYVLKEETVVEYPINTKVLNTQTNNIYTKKEDGWYKTSDKTSYTDEMVTDFNCINIIEEKIIEPLPQFKVIETIETITKVENNEGNQFFIGDKITIISGSLPYTIKGFKCYRDNMVVLIDNNELDINDIEHYIEPKVEFILPEKWCIKVTNRNLDYFKSLSGYKTFNLGNWSSIIGLNDACDTSKVTKQYVEITFDQFKKYVLKKEVKEETLLDKAKRLYPVGTKFKAARGNHDLYIVSSISRLRENVDGAICIEDNGNGTIYFNNEWADIIE